MVVFLGRFEPAGHNHALLGVEGHAFLGLNVQVAEEGLAPAGKREPGHRRGHGDVDADHPGLEAVFEFAGGPPGAREDHRPLERTGHLR